MEYQSLSDQRRAAAAKFRGECLNAAGDVECSECAGAVNEARANRNAQELDREGIRKANKGPICTACQASWRHSHHQEMVNSDDTIKDYVRSNFGVEWDGISQADLITELQRQGASHRNIQAVVRVLNSVVMENEEVSKHQREVEQALRWMRSRARKFKSKEEAASEAVSDADFSPEAAKKAASYLTYENARENTYSIGDHVDVHGEVGVVVKVKGNDLYLIRFNYGTVEVHDDDIEGISSHYENATADLLKETTCPFCGADNQRGWTKCRICHRTPEKAQADVDSFMNATKTGTCDECGDKDVKVVDVVVRGKGTQQLCRKCWMKNDDSMENADEKIMVHCDQCNKTFYEAPDGDGLCPQCKSERKNADEKEKCSRCGAKVGAMGIEHGYDVYCVDCAVEKGYIDAEDVP